MLFTKKELLACVAVASRDETREGLGVVRFEAESIVSTDGHRIVQIEDPERKTILDAPFSISWVDAKSLAQVMGASDRCAPRRCGHRRVGAIWRTFEILGVGRQADPCGFPEVGGKPFPDYRKCRPTDKPESTVTLDARYLKTMADAVIKAGTASRRAGMPVVTIELRGNETAVVLTSGPLRGLIMPCRP